MTTIQRVNEKSYSFAAPSLLLKEVFYDNRNVAVSPTLNTLIAHGDATSNQVYSSAITLHNGNIFVVASSAENNAILNPYGTPSLTKLQAHGMGTSAFAMAHQIDKEWVFLTPASADYYCRQSIVTGEILNIGAAHGLTGVPFTGSCRTRKNGRPVVVICPNTHSNIVYVYLDTLEIVEGPTLTAKQWCVTLPSGNVLFGTNLAILNIETDTIVTTGTSNISSSRGLVLSDGSVVGVPNASSAAFAYRELGGVIVSASKSPAFSPTGSDKFGGAAMLPNGHIVFAPSDYANVVYWNQKLNTLTTGPSVSGADRYCHAVPLSNGKVVFIPEYSPTFGIYDHFGGTAMSGQMPFSALAGPFWS